MTRTLIAISVVIVVTACGLVAGAGLLLAADADDVRRTPVVDRAIPLSDEPRRPELARERQGKRAVRPQAARASLAPTSSAATASAVQASPSPQPVTSGEGGDDPEDDGAEEQEREDDVPGPMSSSEPEIEDVEDDAAETADDDDTVDEPEDDAPSAVETEDEEEPED